MAGIIYALTNPAMDGLVKIGRTVNLRQRVRALGDSSVPFPFEVVRAVQVEDPERAERQIHDAFQKDRVNPKREFFEISTDQVSALFGLLVGLGATEVSYDVQTASEAEEDQESQRAADFFKRRRRPNLNFRELDIPTGSILHWADDETIQAEIVGERKVLFDGEESYLSGVTKSILGTSSAVRPAGFWLFDGRLLSDLYDAKHGTGAL